MTSPEACALCNHHANDSKIEENGYVFCCHGCQVVFRILSTKNQLTDFQNHPLFQQAVRSGLIANPALLEQVRRKQYTDAEKRETEKLHFEIHEMWCPSCAEVIKLVLLQEQGIHRCIVDYATDQAVVEFMPRHIAKERIFELIMQFGYQPVTFDSCERRTVSFSLYLRFIVAAFFSLNIMMFAYPLYATYFAYDDQSVGPLFAWLSMAASLPVLLYSALPIFSRFYYSLKVGLLGMEALVILGVLSAFSLSLYELFTGGTKVYFDSMTVIITFVLLGKIIETKAKFSAKDSIVRLSKSLPKRGRKRFDDHHLEFVPIKEISKGEVVVVLTGEKVVLDGIVLKGQGTCDESLMNGESLPIIKQEGSKVLGGTILTQGWLAYQVTSTFDESSLQKIVSMIEEEIEYKTQYVRAADRIVQWFVPLVLATAGSAAAYCLFFSVTDSGQSPIQTAVIRAISILLISCPCAIGIAAPVAEAHLLNAFVKLGAIVRNRGIFTYLGNETVFVFDKTGTVTEGLFTILSGLELLNSSELAALKMMVSYSTHPIALAVNRAIDAPAAAGSKIEEIAGRGIQAAVGEQTYYFGSREFFHLQGLYPESESAPSAGIVTTVFFGSIQGKIFPICLGDRIRQEVPAIISQLAPAKTLLLSGDSKTTVEAVAQACGFGECMWRMTPLQKKECIEALRARNEIVCMLGDGINDAPALTVAHIGISVVSATDVSIQVSDVLLTTDRLDVLPQMRKLAKKGRKIITQNLFWAFFYNAIGIGFALTGLLSPIFSAFAMIISSLIVILNAQRLGRDSALTRDRG
jgi:heavy metal translocating P-type ATPase